jgi:hypothetical protein
MDKSMAPSTTMSVKFEYRSAYPAININPRPYPASRPMLSNLMTVYDQHNKPVM